MITVLFARADSNYKEFLFADVFDADRNALTWQGGTPVIAHPPCRGWGRLRHFAKPRKGEKALALFAIRQVRKWGGVLEHPKSSTLWKKAGLPAPGKVDKYGGFTLGVNQIWWGHKATKQTLLYICGRSPQGLPPIPLSFELPQHIIGKSSPGMPDLPKKFREHTPYAFCSWLIDLAQGCKGANHEFK